MLCGSCNAPMTFSRLMDKAFGDYKAKNLLELFLDDILVHTATFDQMIHRMKMVLMRLTKYGLKLQLSKSLFQKAVCNLGYKVSHKGIGPYESKIEATTKFPVHQTVRYVKSFLCLASYYKRFVNNFTSISSPSTDLKSSYMKGTELKNFKINWTM